MVVQVIHSPLSPPAPPSESLEKTSRDAQKSLFFQGSNLFAEYKDLGGMGEDSEGGGRGKKKTDTFEPLRY